MAWVLTGGLIHGNFGSTRGAIASWSSRRTRFSVAFDGMAPLSLKLPTLPITRCAAVTSPGSRPAY